jgi:hypothetical protein
MWILVHIGELTTNGMDMGGLCTKKGLDWAEELALHQGGAKSCWDGVGSLQKPPKTV